MRPGLIFLAGFFFAAGPTHAEPFSMGADTCLDAPFEDAVTLAQIEIRNTVIGLRPALVGFPALLSVLETGDTRICLAGGMITELAYVDVEADRIVLSADMPFDLSRIVLAHELRHVEQLAHGICPSQSLAMKEYARGVLALEADANVLAALVAWKLKSEGDGSLWSAFESWSKTSDIAARFGAAMAESGDVADAAAAAFDQFYASKVRTELYYIDSCSVYLDRQDREHALPGYLRLADDYLARLCVLPDGRGYPCSDADHELP